MGRKVIITQVLYIFYTESQWKYSYRCMNAVMAQSSTYRGFKGFVDPPREYQILLTSFHMALWCHLVATYRLYHCFDPLSP